MEGKEGLKVNDGGGLYDSAGFIDTIILDCNNSVKQLAGGNYIGFCNGMAEIVKKLTVLKDGVTNEKNAMLKQVDEMGKQLEEERSGECVAGSVHNTLDGAVGSGEERLRDVIFTEGGRLEPDPDHAGA